MKQLLKIIISITLLFTVVVTPVFAASQSPVKEEVVYTNINFHGQKESVHVINSFDSEDKETFKDYGDYEKRTNLSTEEVLSSDSDEVTINKEEGIFYYQGDNPKAELPWNIDISYNLDGKEVEPESLVGAKGEVDIDLSIKKNDKAESVFFDHYLLQLMLSFPADKVEVLEAEGATVASQGDLRMLNFTHLPGKEGSIHVKLKAKDFEMEPMQISGLPFNMAFDLPDMSTYTKDLLSLQEGIEEVYKGTGDLAKGMNTLSSEGQRLASGGEQFSGAMNEIGSASSSYLSGLHAYQSGLNEFASGAEAFTGGLNELQGGIDQFGDGLNQWSEGASQYISGVSEYTEGVGTYADGVSQAVDELGALASGATQLKEGANRLDATPLVAASEQIQGALSTISSSVTIPEGIDQVGALLEGSVQIRDGLNALSGQGTQFVDAIAASQQGISDMIKGTEAISTGLFNPPVDMLQDPNNPDVQLLIQTMSALGGGLNEIIFAQENLLLGLGQIRQGLEEYNGGLSALSTQYSTFHTGLETLVSSISDSSSGLQELKSGLETLSSQYQEFHQGLVQFSQGTDQLKGAISSFSDGTNQATGELSALKSASEEIKAGGEALSEGGAPLVEGAKELAGGAKELSSNVPQIISGSRALSSGARSLANNFNSLTSGFSQFDSGLSAISSNFNSFTSGIGAYVSGVGELSQGMNQYEEGVGELYKGTRNMDKEMKETIQETMDELMPSTDFELVSFTDKRNQVDRVQFVFLSDGIKEEPVETTTEPVVEEKGFFERLFDLFR